MKNAAIEIAKDHFGKLLENQMKRMERIKAASDWIDYGKLKPVVIGILAGDGIGPYIAKDSKRVLETILAEEVKEGKVVIRDVEGLTIENRAAHRKSIPDEVMGEIKKCHISLKGPTTTPRVGDRWPNLESCNVAMRKELDLFANVRPVRIPNQGIDWIFFRENTEDTYALGPYGIEVDEDIAIDFKLISTPGSERIARLAFEHAKKNNRSRVTCVTKANIIKTSDGRFLKSFYRIAKEYPEIQADDWYIDIMTAKLIDEKRRRDFQVLVLPNLYGDILTDEAAEFQGGVGTAGSANIGKQYAMFEAIHGSAPRMVEEGRAQYADPASMIRAVSMLVGYLGYQEKSKNLEMALDLCGQYEKRLVITGRSTGATGEEFTSYVLDWLGSSNLQKKWEEFVIRHA
jgi:isocitrate dehydrogenase (NAD+)